MEKGVDRGKYRAFKVLLDEPAGNPVLGFDDYAEAFADIIVESKPQFAIGIFGDWGSGKTTLMRAIEAALSRRILPTRERSGNTSDGSDRPARKGAQKRMPAFIIPIWFNAWRYEREEHLIIPLLDTLREGLATSAALGVKAGKDSGRLRKAATTVGRAARALAAGLSVKASISPVDVQFDPKQAMDAWSDADAAADDPLSFYHSTFRQMKLAIDEVVGDGLSRVVIFIDDLDRCLPLNALEVLEGMKLFFDLEGFVFVVGLDQNVIERSIEMKYQSGASSSSESLSDASRDIDGPAMTASQRDGRSPGALSGARRNAPITGAEYIKKLFQVPFTIPRIDSGDLERFVDSIIATNDLPPEQQRDLNDVVKLHLAVATSAESGSVNPREVKRLINAYTLQMKMLSAKLDQKPDPNIVVALQTMAFRADWRDLYDLLVAGPEVFAAAVREVVEDPQRRIEFSLRNEPLPTTFLDYVRGPASQLIANVSLDPYVTSAESFGSTNPAVAQARTIVARLRRLVTSAAAGSIEEAAALEQLHGMIAQLYSTTDRATASSSPQAFDAYQLVNQLQAEARQFPPPLPGGGGAARWTSRVMDLLDSIERNLREVRRQSNVTAAS